MHCRELPCLVRKTDMASSAETGLLHLWLQCKQGVHENKPKRIVKYKLTKIWPNSFWFQSELFSQKLEVIFWVQSLSNTQAPSTKMTAKVDLGANAPTLQMLHSLPHAYTGTLGPLRFEESFYYHIGIQIPGQNGLWLRPKNLTP